MNAVARNKSIALMILFVVHKEGKVIAMMLSMVVWDGSRRWMAYIDIGDIVGMCIGYKNFCLTLTLYDYCISCLAHLQSK